MELIQWFLTGIAFTLAVQFVAYYSLKLKMSKLAWSGVISGFLLVFFGIAWAASSFIEDIPQSGALGLVAFCVPGILIVTFLLRKFSTPVR